MKYAGRYFIDIKCKRICRDNDKGNIIAYKGNCTERYKRCNLRSGNIINLLTHFCCTAIYVSSFSYFFSWTKMLFKHFHAESFSCLVLLTSIKKQTKCISMNVYKYNIFLCSTHNTKYTIIVYTCTCKLY